MNEDIVHALIMDTGEKRKQAYRTKNGGRKTMLDDSILKLDQTTLPKIIRMVPHEMIKELKSRPERL